MNRDKPPPGEFLPDDTMPSTLEPLLDSLFREMLPYLEGLLRVAKTQLDQASPLPRFMDDVEFPMADGRYHRPAMPYGLWMLQRALDAARAMPPADVALLRGWLARQRSEHLLSIEIPRLRRAGLRVALTLSPTSDAWPAVPVEPRMP